MENVVEASDLGYAYRPGEFAVRHLSFSLHRGEIFGLLGRNGAGKTTTVRLLSTLLPPTEGGGRLFGKELRRCGRAERGRIGVVLQAESLDFVTVEENLRLYAFLWGVPREVARSRAEEMLELFELDPVRQRKPWALSGGERRRFQVARELMHEMELLFLDEPTVGLDALTRGRILDYLARRARDGLTIVFTTHILHEADRLCRRVAVLQGGRLATIAPPSELKRRHGGARTVEVEFDRELLANEAADLDQRLLTKGDSFASVDRTHARLVFRARNAEDLVAELARWAEQHGVGIERISVQETTLEEAFVSLVAEPTGPGDRPTGTLT